MACRSCEEARQRAREAIRSLGRGDWRKAADEARMSAGAVSEKIVSEAERVRARLMNN